MTRDQQVTIAIALTLLAFSVASADGLKPIQRGLLGVLGVYWFSVWIHGSIWHL